MAKDRTVQTKASPIAGKPEFDQPAQLNALVAVRAFQPLHHKQSNVVRLEMYLVLYSRAIRITLRHCLVLLYRFDRAGTRRFCLRALCYGRDLNCTLCRVEHVHSELPHAASVRVFRFLGDEALALVD